MYNFQDNQQCQTIAIIVLHTSMFVQLVISLTYNIYDSKMHDMVD